MLTARKYDVKRLVADIKTVEEMIRSYKDNRDSNGTVDWHCAGWRARATCLYSLRAAIRGRLHMKVVGPDWERETGDKTEKLATKKGVRYIWTEKEQMELIGKYILEYAIPDAPVA
jgi:hypothetical protein